MNSGIEELKKMFFIISLISNYRHFLELIEFFFNNLQNLQCSHGSNVSGVTICTNVSQQVQSPPVTTTQTTLNDIATDNFYKLSNYGLENISPLSFLSQHLSSVVMKRKCETIMFTASCFPVVEFITTLILGII